MRPFFPYYGSKWNTARYYPAPTHRTVVEPFAGSAGYATFYGGEKVILYDTDPIIAGLWSYLIGVSGRERISLPELPEPGDCVDDYNIPQEARWLIGFWLNRGSAQPKKSRTAYSSRTDRGQLNWGLRAKERIASQLDAIRSWKVVEGSFASVPDHKATWFVDPPYGEKGKYYRHGFDDYESLGPWCLTRRGQVIVCENEGAVWLPFEPLGSFKSSNGRSREVVYLQP